MEASQKEAESLGNEQRAKMEKNLSLSISSLSKSNIMNFLLKNSDR